MWLSYRPGRTVLPAGVDHARLRPLVLQDVGVGPDGDDLAAAHGDGLGDRELRVDGDDLGVVDDQVGRVGPGRGTTSRVTSKR